MVCTDKLSKGLGSLPKKHWRKGSFFPVLDSISWQLEGWFSWLGVFKIVYGVLSEGEGEKGKRMKQELEEGKVENLHHLDWLKSPWPKGGINLTHSWGLLFCFLERGIILLLQSLALSSKDKVPVLCFITCNPFPFCCLQDTRVQSPSPRGPQPLCVMTQHYLWHASNHCKSFWEGLTLQS